MGGEADAAERGRAARTRRPFPNFFDGVVAMAHCRNALFMIMRESARLARERRQFRDCTWSTQARLR